MARRRPCTEKRLYTDADRAVDYRTVFGSEAGQRVFNDLIVSSHVMRPIEPGDPLRMAYLEGMRALVLRAMTYLVYEPQDFLARARAIRSGLEEYLSDGHGYNGINGINHFDELGSGHDS